MGKVPRVIVVGSGIAGLTAAYELQKAACDVIVLEAADHPGGRMANVRSGSMLTETGATEIFSFYTDLLAMVHELGIADDLVEADHYRTFRIMDQGRGHDFDYGAGPWSLIFNPRLSLREKLRLPLLFRDLLRARRTIDPCALETAAEFDDEDLAGYLSRKVGPNFVDGFIGPLFRLFWRWQPTEFSRAYFLAFVAHTLGSRIYTFRQGIGHLVTTLARRLDVRCGARVHEVQRLDDGTWRITYATMEGMHTIEADAVVMATPAAVVAATMPDLAPYEREFLESVRYSQGVAVHYILNRPVEPVSMIYSARDPSKLLSFAQVPAGAPGFPDVPDRLWISLTPEYLLPNVAPDGANLDALTRPLAKAHYPGLDEDLAEVHTQYDGLRLVLVYPGFVRKLKTFLDRDRRLKSHALCGDYLAHPHTGGACRSGKHAARSILDYLRSAA